MLKNNGFSWDTWDDFADGDIEVRIDGICGRKARARHFLYLDGRAAAALGTCEADF
jgi:hypothetical protein